MEPKKKKNSGRAKLNIILGSMGIFGHRYDTKHDTMTRQYLKNYDKSTDTRGYSDELIINYFYNIFLDKLHYPPSRYYGMTINPKLE